MHDNYLTIDVPRALSCDRSAVIVGLRDRLAEMKIVRPGDGRSRNRTFLHENRSTRKQRDARGQLCDNQSSPIILWIY